MMNKTQMRPLKIFQYLITFLTFYNHYSLKMKMMHSGVLFEDAILDLEVYDE